VERSDIHVDTASGAMASRAKLYLVLQQLRPRDTLMITRLDRLSRSVLRQLLHTRSRNRRRIATVQVLISPEGTVR
jgi:DNA invertase Pin-like site-specific DNA recombinase